MQGARTLGITVREFLAQLKAAGLGSLPGTAAEVLDDPVRAVLCADKLSTAEWLDVVRVSVYSEMVCNLTTAWCSLELETALLSPQLHLQTHGDTQHTTHTYKQTGCA